MSTGLFRAGRREAQDALHRDSTSLVSTLASLSALESDLLAKTLIGQRGKPAHRLRPLSTDPGRQDFSQPGTGFLQARHLSRRCALRRPAGQAPLDTFVRCLLPKLSTTITRTRWFPAQSTRLAPRAWRWALGPTTLPGEGVRTHTRFLRFGVSHSPLFEAS